MVTVVLTSGTSWTTPADWNNANNSVICIGGGGGGSATAANVTKVNGTTIDGSGTSGDPWGPA